MNSHTILSAKVDFLSGNSEQDIDETMKETIENNPELKREIAFVEAFWHKDNDIAEEQPGSNLDARFYQMLSQAQSAQISALEPTVAKPSLVQRLQDWLMPQSFANGMMQVAMMGLVFTLGYYVKAPGPQLQDDLAANPSTEMAGLKDEVQSLNALVALSMINNNSASTRLTGIDYSKQSDANDETLNTALLKMLNHDKSTAVRLAAIDALAERGISTAVEIKLVDSLEKQKTLVQIGLIKLLNNHGSQYAQIKLAAMSSEGKLTDDANEVYQEFKSIKQHNNQI